MWLIVHWLLLYPRLPPLLHLCLLFHPFPPPLHLTGGFHLTITTFALVLTLIITRLNYQVSDFPNLVRSYLRPVGENLIYPKPFKGLGQRLPLVDNSLWKGFLEH